MWNQLLQRPARVVAAALTAAALAGCGAAGAAAPGTSSAPSAPSTPSAAGSAGGHSVPRTMAEGKGSGKPDGTFPRTVVHFQGETAIASAPKRVVVISTGQADVLLTLGVVPVGSTAGEGAEMIPDYLAKAFPKRQAELKKVTYVGNRTAPDIETIGKLKPDLILVNIAGKDANLYPSLSEIAPTVATQGTGVYWKPDMLLVADAIGKAEQAQRWLDTYHADTAAYGKTLAKAPSVSFLRKNADRLRVFGLPSFSGSVAEDSGLARPQSQQLADTSVDISAEQLTQADADWIFYGVQGGDLSAITGQPLWPTLSAVKAGRAVVVDDDVFYLNVGPTAARGIFATLKSTLG